jgi:hypothetical protein
MRIIGITGFLWFACTNLWANSTIDVYGLPEASSQRIVQKYAKRVSDIEARLLDKALDFSSNSASLTRLILQKKRLINDIQREGPYAFVDIQTFRYPGEKTNYSTIEVVRTDQPQRLRYVESRPKTYPIIEHHDSVDEMYQFEQLTARVMMHPDFVIDKTPCPVYHCIISFNHPELKPYLARFNQAILTKKPLIVDTLNHDPNPQRRAAAAFLIGHDPDPNYILNTLLPHVNDPDSGVRNNVLRVIATTLTKSHITSVNPAPFLELLDSPYGTDRNKSLAVLLTIADSQQGKQMILKKGSHRLVNLLQLQQPNNHKLAHLILKKISDKTYDDRAIQAWHTWLEQSHRQRL